MAISKTMHISDLHGVDLKRSEIARYVDREQPDLLVNHGDFDDVKTIRQWVKLSDLFENQGLDVVTLPGNHDLSLARGNEIYSGTINKQGEDFHSLARKIDRDPEAREYLNSLTTVVDGVTPARVRRTLTDQNGKEYKMILIHGGYEGDLSSNGGYARDGLEKNTWVRLRAEDDHQENFKVMEAKGYDIMVRGHDHEPDFTYKDPSKGIVTYDGEPGSRYNLKNGRIHTMTVGALHGRSVDRETKQGKGNYMTINAEAEGLPYVEYHEIPVTLVNAR